MMDSAPQTSSLSPSNMLSPPGYLQPDRFEPMLVYLIPALVLVLITPVNILFSKPYGGRARRKLTDKASTLKLRMSIFLFACEVALTVFDMTESNEVTGYYLIPACMPTIAASALCFEYLQKQLPPALLQTYLGMVCLADVARVWNYQLSSTYWIVSLLSLSAALVNAILLLSGSYIKIPGSITSIAKNLMREKDEDELCDKSLLERLQTLVRFGFLTWDNIDDLPHLGDELLASNLSQQFEPIWADTNKQSEYALLKSVLRVLSWSLIDVVPPRLFYVGLQMYMNCLVRRILVFVSENGVEQHDTKDNIILAMGLTLCAMTVAGVWHTYMIGRLNVLLNGLLMSNIVRKNLAVPSAGDVAGQATTHLNSSVDEILSAMPYIHDTWIAPLEILLGLYFFHGFEGVLTYFLLLPLLASVVVAYYIGQGIIQTKTLWYAATDTRLNRSNDILPHLKSLRILGLEQTLVDYLQAYRTVEVTASTQHNFYFILTWISTAIFEHTSKLAVLAGGIYWTRSMVPIEAVRVFSSFYLVSIIVQPTFALIQRGPLIKSTSWPLYRLQGYLLSRETSESRDLKIQDCDTLESSDSAVVFRNASIAAEDSDLALIKGLSCTIKKGSFVLLTGPVSSGKSLLLKAVAGAARVLHGAVEIAGDARSISYCGQTPWLPNSSIQDTIVGNLEFDRDWYITVITACQLRAEIRRLPGGDKFKIGLEGRNLSGGQRQRLALARAIYSRAPILVLDDVFSVLDQTTLLAIITDLFKQDGLLRRMHTTVFLATRAAEFFRLAHQIFDLDADHNVHIASGNLEIGQLFIDKINRNELPRKRVADSLQSKEWPSLLDDLDQNAEQPPQMMPLEDPEAHHQSYHLLFFKSIPSWILVLWLLLNFITANYEGMPDTFTRFWVDQFSNNSEYFWYYVLVIIVALPCIASVAGLYLLYIVPRCALDFHLGFLDALMRTPLAVLTSMGRSETLTELARQIAPLGFDIPWAFKSAAYRTFLYLSDLALVVYGIPRFVYAVPACIALTSAIALVFLRGARRINCLSERAMVAVNLALRNVRSGLEHIRSMGLQKDYLAEGFQILDQLQRTLSAKVQLQVWLMLFLHLLVSFILLTITTLAVYFPSNTLTAGGVGLAFCSTQWIWLVLHSLLNTSSRFDNLISSVSRLLRFIEETPTRNEHLAEVPRDWPQNCEIVLDNVDASYRTPTTEYIALQNISLTIPAGKKVGIIGRTGSGKSSLILTLLKQLDYTGSIKIDNVELSSIPADLIYSATTVIPQEFAGIPGTIRDNVYPWDLMKAPNEKSATDDRIIRVLQQLKLWSFVEQHGGLNVLLTTLNFSDGQKRLLGIARAILHQEIAQTKLVLMDEATGGLDEGTEAHVDAIMAEAFSNCTVLTVTHRPQDLKDVKSVAEITNGKLVVLPPE